MLTCLRPATECSCERIFTPPCSICCRKPCEKSTGQPELSIVLVIFPLRNPMTCPSLQPLKPFTVRAQVCGNGILPSGLTRFSRELPFCDSGRLSADSVIGFALTSFRWLHIRRSERSRPRRRCPLWSLRCLLYPKKRTYALQTQMSASLIGRLGLSPRLGPVTTVTPYHHQPEAQHPKSSAINKIAGRLAHLRANSRHTGNYASAASGRCRCKLGGLPLAGRAMKPEQSSPACWSGCRRHSP